MGKRLLIAGLLSASVIIFLIVLFSWASELNKSVVFAYQPYPLPYESYSTQNLTVRIDLSDGMDINEAIQVGHALFDDCMGTYQHEVTSANMTQEGSWMVSISWDYGHWFKAIIDPADRTIIYERCK